MAEGWAKKLKHEIIDVCSAGVETHGLNPDAVKVMAEAGVDISNHRSKLIDEFKDTELDAVITVCGHARETCPYFPPRCKVIHVGFDDPPKLAEALAKKGESKEKQLDCFRKVRDEIKAFVEKMPENIFTE
jgi:arsenate reductase